MILEKQLMHYTEASLTKRKRRRSTARLVEKVKLWHETLRPAWFSPTKDNPPDTSPKNTSVGMSRNGNIEDSSYSPYL